MTTLNTIRTSGKDFLNTSAILVQWKKKVNTVSSSPLNTGMVRIQTLEDSLWFPKVFLNITYALKNDNQDVDDDDANYDDGG